MLIDRPSFIHRSFSDLTLLAAYNEPKTSADAARDFEIATSYTRAFFDKHLKGAPDTLLERAAAPYDGVRVDRFNARVKNIPEEILLRLVAQIFPRWNPLRSWMRHIEDFQRAA